MPEYQYSVFDAQGTRIEGTLKQHSMAATEAYLRALGYRVVSVHRMSVWRSDIRTLPGLFGGGKTAPKKALAVFCRQMSFALDAGLPVKTALSLLAGQPGNRRMQHSLQQAHTQVLKGESFSQAMMTGNCFPPFLCNLCRIGEMSATLPPVMAQLADYYERQARTDDELSAALMYPAMVTLMMLTVMTIAVTFVLPAYAMVFASAGIELPALTRALIAFSDAVNRYAYFLPVLAVIIPFAYLLFAKSKTAQIWKAYVCLYFPLIRSIYRKNINLHFVQALSILLMSGQSLVEAVPPVIRVTDNIKVQRDLHILLTGMEEGQAFWRLLARIPYIDSLLADMARVGEETGRLSETLEKCSLYMQHEIESLIRRLSKLVEPLITVVLGLLLGLIMLAVMLPAFSLAGAW